MLQTERTNDFNEALRVAMENNQASLWTALPGIIQSFDTTKGTCKVQPAIKARVRDARGNLSWVTLPLLVDVPVVFPSAGGFTITFPVQQGNECLVIFSSRCIDGWWQQGGVQVQAELRLHDLSDGFAILGPKSLPTVQALGAPISPNTLQIRKDDGTAYIEMTATGAINIVAPGGVHVTGAVVASGEGTFNGGHTVSAHVHGGVAAGAGTTNPPTG